MTIIIGVDPGSRTTGFGVIQLIDKKLSYVDSGYVSVADKAMDQRLQTIFTGLCTVMKTYQPEEAAIEQVFMHQNPGAALKLGQARGAAMVALTSHGVHVDEYSARQVKQSVVGYGAAKKDQVQHMICHLLNLKKAPQADAADALAIAICHANTSESLLGITGARGVKQGRWR